MKFVAIGILVLLAVIVATPSLHMNLLGAVLIVIFGFLFVTVFFTVDRRNRLIVESNLRHDCRHAAVHLPDLPDRGWTGGRYFVMALSIGGIVCIASSNGGTTSQDLKTGYLVGATPRLQQIAILCGHWRPR